MLSNNLQDYKNLWENPELYLLAPDVSYSKDSTNGESHKYSIHKRHAMNFSIVLVIDSMYTQVINKMIKSGVEIRLSPIKMEDEFRVERLWTDRVAEFVIIPLEFKNHTYTIYHLQYREYILPHHIKNGKYDKIINKMVECGVEVWSKKNWTDYKAENLQ